MIDKELDALVLHVVAGQSDGYLIHPTASAFVAVGLTDPSVVEESMTRLEGSGLIDRAEDVVMRFALEPALDDDGEPMATPDGEPVYRSKLDEEGRQLVEPALDEDGNEIVLAAGWALTDDGRKAYNLVKKQVALPD